MKSHFRARPIGWGRPMGYLLLAAIVLGSLAIGPQAWATPDQAQMQQTVPTRTPRPVEPTPAPRPTEEARPTAAPQPTEEPRPTAAPQPTDTPAPVASPTVVPAVASPVLSLTLVASPLQVWSGVTVIYTLTVENRSSAALRDVALVAQAPAGLQPVASLAPAGAGWNGQAWQATLAELSAGASAQAVFTARVAPQTPAGRVIVVSARASAAGAAASATAAVAMPPAELPAVGRDADFGR